MAYFPNGTAGEILDNQCCDCFSNNEWIPCPVYAVCSLFNYDQVDKGQEKLRQAINMLVDEKGTCLMRAAIQNQDDRKPTSCMKGMEKWAKDHGIEII